MSQHRCLMPNCKKPLSRRHWMCAAEWNLVPETVREAIEDTNRALAGVNVFNPHRAREMFKAHRTAKRVAVMCVLHAQGKIFKGKPLPDFSEAAAVVDGGHSLEQPDDLNIPEAVRAALSNLE